MFCICIYCIYLYLYIPISVKVVEVISASFLYFRILVKVEVVIPTSFFVFLLKWGEFLCNCIAVKVEEVISASHFCIFVFSYFCESGGSHPCLSPASATGLTTTCWSTTHLAQPFFSNISNIDLEDNNIWNIDQQSTYWSTTLLAQPFFSINTNIDLKYSRYFTTFKIHLVCWSTFIFKYSKHQ